jgi:hypothetical protein
MNFSNCLTFAIRVWEYSSQSYLMIRKSKWGWFPHFAVMFERGEVIEKVEYVPVEPRKKYIPPLFFKGVIRRSLYKRVDDSINVDKIS